MAIINSIVMGKSKGKIGNVVTTTLKGQVIAKSRNFSPANPKSALQTASRGKMSNAVKAWQFLSSFLSMTSSFAKKTESTYNAFVSATKNLFSDTIAEFGYIAATHLYPAGFFTSALASVSYSTFDADSLTISLAANGVAYNPDLHVRVIYWESATGSNIIIDRLVTGVEYDAGQVVVDEPLQSNNYCGFYIYSRAASKCSNVVIQEL